MSETATPTTQNQASSPDYAGLVRFLVAPFLESSESLSIDCELSQSRSRVWIRMAFEGEDKGRVFGRGGRNIQAIKTVLEASAQAAGQSVHLDIYGGTNIDRREGDSGGGRSGPRHPPNRRPPSSRPSSQIRSR